MLDQGGMTSRAGERPVGTGWSLRLALVAFVVLAHGNGVTGTFQFDDVGAIVDNPTIRDLSDLRTVLLAPTFATVVNRPLLNLSLALNYLVSGVEPWSYRVVNILIHAVNALMVAFLVRVVLSSSEMPPLLKREAEMWSTLGAALWAAHPLTTAAVAYVIQRAEALMSLFFLAGLCALSRGAFAGAEAKTRETELNRGWIRAAGWMVLSFGCFLSGLATKEVAVMFAPIALLFDRWFLAPN